jgi:hypothetical protein
MEDNSQWTTEREPQSLAADDAAYRELVQIDQATEDIPLDEDLPTTEIQTQDF